MSELEPRKAFLNGYRVSGLLICWMLSGCGGSSSETPMPLEPLPYSGPEKKIQPQEKEAPPLAQRSQNEGQLANSPKKAASVQAEAQHPAAAAAEPALTPSAIDSDGLASSADKDADMPKSVEKESKPVELPGQEKGENLEEATNPVEP